MDNNKIYNNFNYNDNSNFDSNTYTDNFESSKIKDNEYSNYNYNYNYINFNDNKTNNNNNNNYTKNYNNLSDIDTNNFNYDTVNNQFSNSINNEQLSIYEQSMSAYDMYYKIAKENPNIMMKKYRGTYCLVDNIKLVTGSALLGYLSYNFIKIYPDLNYKEFILKHYLRSFMFIGTFMMCILGKHEIVNLNFNELKQNMNDSEIKTYIKNFYKFNQENLNNVINANTNTNPNNSNSNDVKNTNFNNNSFYSNNTSNINNNNNNKGFNEYLKNNEDKVLNNSFINNEIKWK